MNNQVNDYLRDWFRRAVDEAVVTRKMNINDDDEVAKLMTKAAEFYYRNNEMDFG